MRKRVDVPPFTVRSVREGREHRLAPVGELDIATVEGLERAFDAVRAEEAVDSLVIDLGEATFMDSTGLHLLLRINAACVEAGLPLRVLIGPPAIERLFDITGVRDLLPIVREDGDPRAPIAS